MDKVDGKIFLVVLLTMVLLSLFMNPVLAFPAGVDTEDVPGSEDHPLISRFPGSYIRYYNEKNYGEFTLPFSELKEVDDGNVPQEDKTIEGEITRNFYVIPDGHSVLEVYRNYEMALEDAGFDILRKQEEDLSYGFADNRYNIKWDASKGSKIKGIGVDAERSRQFYLAARLERAEGDVYISLYIAETGFGRGASWGKQRPTVLQTVVEEKDMETGLITASSDFEEKTGEEEEAVFPEGVKTADVPDSRDHPAISRFPGSYIRYYDEKNYDEFNLPFSELKEVDEKNVPKEDKKVEGKITKNFYVIPDGHSALEVYRNYEMALEEAGFNILRKQEKDLSYGFGRNRYNIRWDACEGCEIKGIGVDNETSRQFYLAGQLERAEGDLYISLYIAETGFGRGANWGKQRPTVLQTVVEEKEMETGLISTESILQDIESKGKVSIYGVYFDTDSAEIKSDSEATVEKIAEVLRENPKLNIHIVGHTDNTGDFDYNLKLSEKRAAALVNKLVNKYEINEERLEAAGVGPLAPKASNETKDGRAKNRRVELVKK
ncbi:MAG: OmpA family protein [Halanaerobacter sp.]